MTRVQHLIPRMDLSEIPEPDLWSAGDLKADDFKVEIIVGEDETDSIPNFVEEIRPGMFVNKIRTGFVLKEGVVYRRTTTLEAPGAFTDSVRDAFYISVPYDTDNLSWKITFEKPRTIDCNRVEVVQTKVGGHVLPEPKRIASLCTPSAESIFCLLSPSPQKNDQYLVYWYYLTP